MDRNQLISEAKQGQRQALVDLIMERKDDYYRLAYVLTGNPHDAGDAMEDMILILFEKIHQLRDGDAFFSWSRTILGNCCRKILRERRREMPMEQLSDQAAAADLDTEEKMVLETGLMRLGKPYREVIRLRYYLDYDYQAVADTLSIPLGTVKSRLSQGLKKLKTILECE